MARGRSLVNASTLLPFGLAVVGGVLLGRWGANVGRLTSPVTVIAGRRYAFTLELPVLPTDAGLEGWRAGALAALTSAGATNVRVSGQGPLYASFELVVPVTALISPGQLLYPSTVGLTTATVRSVKGPL